MGLGVWALAILGYNLIDGVSYLPLLQVIFNGNRTIANTEGPAGITIAADHAVFKTAWWLGSATDNNMGTVAYPAMDTIAPGMTPDGWADEGWYRLLQVSPSVSAALHRSDTMHVSLTHAPCFRDVYRAGKITCWTRRPSPAMSRSSSHGRWSR
jgi:hypothetical protein